MTKALNVLLVEDSENDAMLILRELQREGYEIRFERVDLPDTFAAALRTMSWDVILADYSMPRFSAIEALELLQKSGIDLPFIIVSGMVGEDAAVKAMKAGAHDYVIKSNLARLAPAIERERNDARVRSERQRAIEELRQQRDRMQQYVDVAEVILMALNVHGEIELLNSKGCRILGCDSRDILGKRWIQTFVPEEDRQLHQQRFDRWITGKLESFANFEGTVLTKSGDRRLIAWHNSFLTGTNGEIIGSLSSGEDITDRRKTEERQAYQAHLLASISDAVIATDETFRFTAWNRSAEAMYGWREDEVLGKQLDKIISRTLVDTLRGKLSDSGKTASRCHWEMVHYRKSNQPIQVEGTTIRLVNSAGSITGYLSVHRDITAKVHAEEVLCRSEERFFKVFRSSPAAIAIETASEGRLVEVNDRYTEFSGYRREELVGSTVAELQLWADPQNREEVLRKTAATGVVRNLECKFRKKSGEVRIALLSLETIQLPNEPIVITMLSDITERKQAEEALRFTQFSIDKAADAIFWVGSDARLLYVNETASRLLGYSPEQLLSMKVPEIDPRFAAVDWTKRWNLLKRQKTFVFETMMQRSDGSLCPVELTANYLEFKGQEFNVAFARDVTERKRAEDELRQTTERLQALSHRLLEVQEQERRHLARELHDEIGQALTAAKINLQAILRFPDPSVLSKRLDDSIRTIDRLLNQVRQLSLDLRPPLLDDLGLILALKWYSNQQSQRAGLRLELVADSAIPRLDATLETACFRVAQEAITNVVRHAQATEVIIELYPKSGLLHLIVRDNGKGFDMVDTQQRAAQGASLGWLGMRERASLVGGQLSCKSAPGEGTEVHASFPLALRSENSESTPT